MKSPQLQFTQTPKPNHELFTASGSATAPAEFLRHLLPLTEAHLRQLSRETNPATKLPWIPRPTRGRFQITATLAGVFAWMQRRLDRSAGFTVTSMAEAQAVYGIPQAFIRYFVGLGNANIRDNHGRVDIQELLRAAGPTLSKIFSANGAQIKGIEGMDHLDSDLQLARVRKADAEARERENALARETIHTRDQVEEYLRPGLEAIRAGLVKLRKTTGAQIRRTLAQHQVKPECAAEIEKLLAEGIEQILKPIRETCAK